MWKRKVTQNQTYTYLQSGLRPTVRACEGCSQEHYNVLKSVSQAFSNMEGFGQRHDQYGVNLHSLNLV